MIGLYFSGTGNTKHCVELLVSLPDESARALPLESAEAAGLTEKADAVGLFGQRSGGVMPV